MISKKKSNQIIKNFKEKFNVWETSLREFDEQSRIDEMWKEEVKDKYTDSEIISATFWKFDKLHKEEIKNAEILIKATKDLQILLLTNSHFGNDLFQDYEIKIQAVTKNGIHLRKIK